MRPMYRSPGQASESLGPGETVHAGLADACDRCGKQFVYRLEKHYESLNCRMRQWCNQMEAKGWRRAKLSNHTSLDVLGIPYEISPCEPKQGQCLYVNPVTYRILAQSKGRIDSLIGPVWVKRPWHMIKRWLREAKDRGEI